MYSKVYPAFSNLQPFLTEYKACFKDPKAASKKRDKWNRKWQAKRAAEQAELEAKKGVKKVGVHYFFIPNTILNFLLISNIS